MNIDSDKHVQVVLIIMITFTINSVKVTLPDNQLVTVFLRDAMTVGYFLIVFKSKQNDIDQ